MSSGTSRQGGGVGTKVVLFLPLLVVGLLLSVSLINAFARDLKVFVWPKTDCSIIWSAIEENPEGSVEEAYRFKVVYRYSVNGWSFSGDRYAPDYRGSSHSDAQDLLSQFSPGARVPCYYNPEDPSYALLERSNPFILLPLLLVALVLIILGSLGLLRQDVPVDQNAGCMALFLLFVLLCGLTAFTQALGREPVLAGLGIFFAVVGGVGFIVVYRTRLRKG